MIRLLALLLALLPAAAVAQPEVSVGTSATLGYREYDIRVVRRHEAGAARAWRAMERPGYTLSLLIGTMLVRSDAYDCQAEEGPIEQIVPAPAEYPRSDPDYTVYEWRLTESDRERCRAKSGKGWPSGSRFVGLNTGVTLDVPIGERAYLRAGFRPLFTAVVGFGVNRNSTEPPYHRRSPSAGAGRQPPGRSGPNGVELEIDHARRSDRQADRREGPAEARRVRLVRTRPQPLAEVRRNPVHIMGYRMGRPSG